MDRRGASTAQRSYRDVQQIRAQPRGVFSAQGPLNAGMGVMAAEAVDGVRGALWQVPPEGCCWAWSFGDGVAVYHSLIGSTHVLPSLAWQVLTLLAHGCEDEASLLGHLAQRGWFPAGPELAATLTALQITQLASRLD